MITLHTKLSDVIRVQKKQAQALSRLGIETVRDLLYHFPKRYSDISTISTINQARTDEYITIYGVISNLHIKKTYRTHIPTAQATLTDLEGSRISIRWFNQAFIAKTLNEGQVVKLSGKITENSQGKMLSNPEYEKLDALPIDTGESLFNGNEDGNNKHFGFPIYQESRGVSSKWMYHSIIKILNMDFIKDLYDPLPEYLLHRYKLPSLQTALVWVHAPRNKRDAESAKKRFAFEEIFFIQLRNQQRRYQHRQTFSYQLDVDKKTIAAFIERFPFTPTEAQSSSLEAILEDMQSESSMSRLLEGDVGSGKTFVAAVAAYATVMNRPRKKTGGHYDFGRLQVAYMAPTEVLATQLFENFIQYFKDTGIHIALMTGSGCRKFPSKVDPDTWTSISKSQLTKWVNNGEIPIVIGTHALIQKKLSFQDLALAIIDEQHRFGTKQRMKLGSKDHRIPHFLSMTATPIPRTLALTIYGDLDLSVIDAMPKGRKRVETHIIHDDPDARTQVYDDIRKRIEAGRQAYVICPRISDPDPSKENKLQLTSVVSEAKRLREQEFKGLRIDIMHSKMKKSEREMVMDRFYNHEIDVLVSTSVVEVGVNVPNATSIIIEGAERFGLAQLHQLRGRVIRSNHQPFCYLFADAKSNKTKDRLRALVEANSGFELAEIDLSLRGTGDLAGTKQWGMSDLAMEAIKNIKMVEFARKEAQEIIQEDPRLESFPELDAIMKHDSYHIHFE